MMRRSDDSRGVCPTHPRPVNPPTTAKTPADYNGHTTHSFFALPRAGVYESLPIHLLPRWQWVGRDISTESRTQDRHWVLRASQKKRGTNMGAVV